MRKITRPPHILKKYEDLPQRKNNESGLDPPPPPSLWKPSKKEKKNLAKRRYEVPLWTIQVLHQRVRGGGGLTQMADVADALRGWAVGGLGLEC